VRDGGATPSERDALLARADDLAEQGYEAFKTGNAERLRELNAESLELACGVGDARAVARALGGLMRLGLRARDFDAVERLAAECEDVARTADDPTLRRLPLHMRAEAARMRGDLDTARELYGASIALNRELGDNEMVAVERANQSWVEIESGRLDEAERLLRRSLADVRDDDAYGIAFCLLGLARVQLERGLERGAEALGAAEGILEREGLVWDPAEEPEYERSVALAREVADVRLDDLRAAGRALDPRAV
jgi:hypothetical protein